MYNFKKQPNAHKNDLQIQDAMKQQREENTTKWQQAS